MIPCKQCILKALCNSRKQTILNFGRFIRSLNKCQLFKKYVKEITSIEEKIQFCKSIAEVFNYNITKVQFVPTNNHRVIILG